MGMIHRAEPVANGNEDELSIFFLIFWLHHHPSLDWPPQLHFPTATSIRAYHFDQDYFNLHKFDLYHCHQHFATTSIIPNPFDLHPILRLPLQTAKPYPEYYILYMERHRKVINYLKFVYVTHNNDTPTVPE